MIRDIDKTTSLHLNNEVQFLCFTLEEEGQDLSQLYAMNVFKIREIIYYDGEITETAGNNDGIIIGYLTVRGESIPLVDLKRWFHYNDKDPKRDLHDYSVKNASNKNLVVICNFSGHIVGIKILSVKRIIQKSWNDVTLGSEYGFDGSNKITATTKYDDNSVIQIVDVERMLVDAFPNIDDSKEFELHTLGTITSDKIILIAEDSKPAQKSLQVILEKLELNYFTFPNGKALLRYLSNPGVLKEVGAVITDLEMPLISGFEVLKNIKDKYDTKHIPVIINSSMSNDSNLEKAQSLKASAFITKSNPKEIEEALRDALNMHDQEEQNSGN